jgi:hypothetical protein
MLFSLTSSLTLDRALLSEYVALSALHGSIVVGAECPNVLWRSRMHCSPVTNRKE